jgi:hypothetical protein
MIYNSLYKLLKDLKEIGQIGLTYDFDNCIACNIVVIEGIIQKIEKGIKVPAIDNYQKELQEIYIKYCIKDENGEPKITRINEQTVQYHFAKETQEQKALDMAALKVKYDKELTLQQSKSDAFQKKLDSECTEYKPFTMSKETVKEAKEMAGQRLTANHLVSIDCLVKK